MFSANGATFGPLLDVSGAFPSVATRYLEPSPGVQCLSIGPAENNDDYAVKRPIRALDQFQCRSTRFRVLRCVQNCRAAVIQREVTRPNNRRERSTIYVDACIGIVAFSDSEDMEDGVPLEAAILRGEVGILADPNYPRCP